VVNIHNNEVLRGTTTRPQGRLNYDKPRQSRVILIIGRENFPLPFGTECGSFLGEIFL
jgi:hypothetical protein